MSDEEKNYFFFKVHDLDGNDKLDGLEIFYSATHHSDSEATGESHQHHHEHEQQNEIDPAIENSGETNEKHESETGESPRDSTQNSSVTNLKLIEINANDDSGNKNLNHIIGMLKKDQSNRRKIFPMNLSRSELNNWFFLSISDVLDNFLNLADLNNDGYLNYAEYAAAVKLGNAMANAEQHPEL